MNYVEPIRSKDDIDMLSEYFKEWDERNYILFLIGINTGLRIADILRLRVCDVRGWYIVLKENKTKKVIKRKLNRKLKKVLDTYCYGKRSNEPLIKSRNGYNKLITREMVYLIIKTHHDFARDKKWCPAQILNGKACFTLGKVIEMTVGYLNQLNGKVATPSPANNSKKYFDLEPLKADAKAFDALKVGDKVMIRKGQTFWYIPQTNQGVKPTNDFTGDKDVIEQVRDVKVSYSRRAYLLKNKRSWILEQDLVEARRTWNAVKDTDAIFDTDPERVYVYVDGRYYKLVETKK